MFFSLNRLIRLFNICRQLPIFSNNPVRTAIWKSRHRHFGISIVIEIVIGIDIAKKKILPPECFFKKQNIHVILVLSYDISTTLLQIYLFLYDFLFIRPKTSIGVLEKGYLNFQKHPSIGFWKDNCSESFCILPSKHR